MLCAPDAASALDIIEKKDFDVIITDYEMPKLDGISFTKIVRVKLSKALIIGTSGKHMRNDFMRAGANIYLQKPYLFGDMLAIIKKEMTRLDHTDKAREPLEKDMSRGYEE